MALPKRLLYISIVSAAICFAIEWHCNADSDWQLDDSSPVISDEEEIELGKHVDEYIRHLFYLENDPEFNEVVNNIVQRVAAVSERNTLHFTCAILQSLTINAFSAPGGHIYLTYGLLKFAQTEDEVAGIVGHEVAHASLRHVSKLYHEVSETISRHEKGIDSATNLLLLNDHLEEFEQDADTTGVSYAQKAGFNPKGLLDFLERHLNVIIHKGMFGMFSISGSNSNFAINSRINHLKEYISALEKE